MRGNTKTVIHTALVPDEPPKGLAAATLLPKLLPGSIRLSTSIGQILIIAKSSGSCKSWATRSDLYSSCCKSCYAHTLGKLSTVKPGDSNALSVEGLLRRIHLNASNSDILHEHQRVLQDRKTPFGVGSSRAEIF